MKRRDALKGLGAAALATGLTASFGTRPARTANHPLLDPTVPADRAVIHRKLNYTFDDNLVVWYIQARRNGLLDSQFTPFWDMNVGFISTVKDVEENAYEVKTLSAIFYADIGSGKLLERFENPFTGETVDIRPPRLGNSKRYFTIDGLEYERAPREGYRMTEYGDIGPAWVIGDDVWIQADTGFRAEPLTQEGRLSVVNDWFTYHGSISEVSDPAVMSAAATQIFNDINTWPSWLNMGDHPGNYVSRGFGRKVASVEEMPDAWKALMKDIFPEAYKDPRAFVDS